jgi:hypothetical protein
MQSDVEYVYVNQDGTARELSPGERAYLAASFAPADGARPYVKSSYDALDGWGSRSGFLRRSDLPPNVSVQPVNAQYDLPVSRDPADVAAELGELLGAATPQEGRRRRLEQQRAREELARHPDFR